MSPRTDDPTKTGWPPGWGPADRRGDARDRGVSFPLSHAVTLAIATALVSGLVLSAGALLSSEYEQTTDRSVSNVAADLVADLAAVDRLVDGEDATATLAVSSPGQVAGRPYIVSLAAPGPCGDDGRPTVCLSLVVPGTDAERTVPFRNETPVANSSAPGGSIAIEYRDGALVLRDRR